MAKRRTDEQKYEAYELLANAAISLHAGAGTCPKQRAFNIRQVCNGLYDTPSTHTGLVSEEGQHLKKSELVEEHFHARTPSAHKMFEMLDVGATKEELIEYIKIPKWDRIFRIKDALMAGASIKRICESTGIDRWFIYQIQKICECEKKIAKCVKNILTIFYS